MAFIVADRVKETSTSTGTGTLTLAGALTGFQTFAARLAVGDTCYYGIQGIDAGGAPTGEWECGLGTCSGANTLTRTTVTSSSNADAAVTFSAGTKEVFITLPAAQVAWMRERLTAARTYYVRTDGSDSNTGLVNTAGGAFLTIQKAIDNAASTIDTAGYSVTIQLADGTYVENVVGKPVVGGGDVTIQGNSGTPANVLIQPASGICFSFTAIPTIYTLKAMKLDATTIALKAAGGSTRINFSNLNFAATTNEHIYAINGASIIAGGDYTISGAASAHLRALYDGYIEVGSRTVTITGTPAFTQFAKSNTGSMSLFSNTFSGSATGSRYQVDLNGVINTGGATLPGDTAGTTATGGQYA